MKTTHSTVLAHGAWLALLGIMFGLGVGCSDDVPADDAEGASTENADALVFATNLTKNPSFEVNTTGWTGWNSAIARVAQSGAPDGSYVAKVSRTTGTTYTIDDSPATVTSTTAAGLYIGTAYVKAASTPAQGKQFQVILREQNAAGTVVKMSTATAKLTTGFSKLMVSHTAAGQGNSLEIYVAQLGATNGDAFFVDAITLTSDSTGSAPPPDAGASLPDAGGDASTGTGGGSSDGGSEAWIFSPSSPWNVPATGNADPNSDVYTIGSGIGSLAMSFQKNGKGIDIAGTDAYPDYGVPIATATASTPKVKVSDSTGWWGGFSAVPVPDSASPAAGTDRHLAVVDPTTNSVWEFWDMRKTGSTWSAGAGVRFDLNGLGYNTTPGTLGGRAYGGSLVGGAIRRSEMVAGVIPHALAMAYNYPLGKKYARGLGVDGITMNIGSHCDGYADAKNNTSSNIPEGARLRIKSNVDLDARCKTNKACKVIGTALKTYGAYLVDNGGVPVIYSEVLTGTGQSWSGLLDTADARAFVASDFEVLSLPPQLTSWP